MGAVWLLVLPELALSVGKVTLKMRRFIKKRKLQNIPN